MSDSDDDWDVETCLKSLRKSDLCVPEAVFLETSPISLPTVGSEKLLADASLEGRWLAVDLDDTLLMGSFTAGEAWGPMGQAAPGLRKDRLTTDWLASAKQLARGRSERVACRKRHPFLKQPQVEVAFRPGMIDGLRGFKKRGLGLVMVTASARRRVDYLRMRFPVLDELFSGTKGRIVVAEDMVHAALAAEREKIDHEPSASAHAIRPRSLAVKTPWAVSYVAGIPHYDLLVDDSEVTARVFQQAGLADRLLWIEGKHPWSDYGRVVLEAVQARLSSHEITNGDARSLACPPEAMKQPSDVPISPKVEDPLYFPLLHYRDQF